MKVRHHPWITAAVLVAVLLGLTGTATALSRSRAVAEATPVAAAPQATAPDVPGTSAAAPSDGGGKATAATSAVPAAADPAAAAVAVTTAVQSVDALDRSSGGSEFGAAVLDRATGQLDAGANGGTPFYSASVVKLYTVVSILHRVESGEVTLSPDESTDIQRALSLSDDEAMDALWTSFGGPDTVTQTIELAGLTDSSPPEDPSQWGEALISARDVVEVYNYVLTSMTPASRDMIMDDLRNAQDTGADGFDQAFGLLNQPRVPGTAAKQGWMWYGSDLYLHSTGTLGMDQRFVVAVLSRNPAGAGEGAAASIVSKATGDIESVLMPA